MYTRHWAYDADGNYIYIWTSKIRHGIQPARINTGNFNPAIMGIQTCKQLKMEWTVERQKAFDRSNGKTWIRPAKNEKHWDWTRKRHCDQPSQKKWGPAKCWFKQEPGLLNWELDHQTCWFKANTGASRGRNCRLKQDSQGNIQGSEPSMVHVWSLLWRAPAHSH